MQVLLAKKISTIRHIQTHFPGERFYWEGNYDLRWILSDLLTIKDGWARLSEIERRILHKKSQLENDEDIASNLGISITQLNGHFYRIKQCLELLKTVKKIFSYSWYPDLVYVVNNPDTLSRL